MNVFLVVIGSGLMAFIFMQVYGAGKFKEGSKAGISFVFGLGVSLLVWGLIG